MQNVSKNQDGEVERCFGVAHRLDGVQKRTNGWLLNGNSRLKQLIQHAKNRLHGGGFRQVLLQRV